MFLISPRDPTTMGPGRRTLDAPTGLVSAIPTVISEVNSVSQPLVGPASLGFYYYRAFGLHAPEPYRGFGRFLSSNVA